MAVVTPDGKRPATAGKIVLYQLTGGVMLYSATVEYDEARTVLVFKTRSTLMVSLSPGPGGTVNYVLTRADKGLFSPTVLRVPVSSVVFMQDTVDDAFLTKTVEAFTHLTLPSARTN